ncbi:hypothetical protein SISSUDRAFT_1054902 [Sistotremastrum suecicum HHB10207 ss-3]|uniref:Uncharacterized protein n=1 Tax=Sistotremastrum suecicum HHB10207 ss-3 TaxID=1314776 RepID=A0A165Y5S5_9AGAM|nr:hypothetical protein SISSUDRAFT_1054902 [Sistotremastrum suecicum HHB10207 ss-3]
MSTNGIHPMHPLVGFTLSGFEGVFGPWELVASSDGSSSILIPSATNEGIFRKIAESERW